MTGEDQIEYAMYDPIFRRNLVCPCGMSHWVPARMQEGIGGREFWVVVAYTPGDDFYAPHYGCLGCQRIISAKDIGDRTLLHIPIIDRAEG